MALEVDAVYENGVLKLEHPLPLRNNARVRVSIESCTNRASQSYGLLKWNGALEDLDYLINDAENDPLERP
jgi:predicted DNA-binding antitoxin AbrB/MazE fold protein